MQSYEIKKSGGLHEGFKRSKFLIQRVSDVKADPVFELSIV